MRATLSPSARKLVAILLLLCCAATGAAQTTKEQQRGFTTGGSYTLGDVETVSNSNGNVMLNVPLAQLPAGRGGMPGAGLRLVYNSKLWDPQPVASYSQSCSSGGYCTYTLTGMNTFLKDNRHGGWDYAYDYRMEVIDRRSEGYYPYGGGPSCNGSGGTVNHDGAKLFKVRIRFPDGSLREFHPAGRAGLEQVDGYYNFTPDGNSYTCQSVGGSGNIIYAVDDTGPSYGTPNTYYTTDGTYLKLVTYGTPNPTEGQITSQYWSLYFPDGTRVTTLPDEVGDGRQRVYDRNGNFVQFNGHATPGQTATISDQLGRALRLSRGADEDVITASGFGDAELRWTVRWRTAALRGKTYYAGPIGTRPIDWSWRVVESITLPVQTGLEPYVFDYNDKDAGGGITGTSVGWGEVSYVKLPTGAYAVYKYRRDGEDLSNTAFPVLQNHPVRKELTYLSEYDGQSSEVTDRWDYSFNFPDQSTISTATSVTAPDGGVTSEGFIYNPGHWDHGLSRGTTLPDGTTIHMEWQENRLGDLQAYAYVEMNPALKTEYRTVPGSNNTSLTAINDYTYDKNGNVLQVKEYDWVPYSSFPRDQYGNVIYGIPAGAAPKRVTKNTYHNPTPDSSTQSGNANSYDKATAPAVRNALASAEVSDGAGRVLSRSEFTYDNPSTTANLTLKRGWDSTKGGLLSPQPDGTRLDANNSVSVRNEYDDNTTNPAMRFGNLTLVEDANRSRTKYTYGTVTGPDGETFTGLYPTTAVAGEGASVQRTSSSVYDFSTGLVTKTTDEDNRVSTSMTYDALGRPTLVEEADDERDSNNVSLERRTVTEYSGALRRVIVRSDLSVTGDGKFVSVQHYDQLGRARLSRTLEDASAQDVTDETAGIKAQTRYMFSGQNSYLLVSNPYRAATSAAAGSEATMGWSVATSDRAGRVVRAETFGGAGLPAPFTSGSANTSTTGVVLTAYDANTVTVADQTGRKRRSVSDALGRLVRVDEPDKLTGALDDGGGNPVQPTSYAYDALGNLRRVDQGGQQRFFLYDSLGRLVRAKNPEQGHMAADADFPVLTDDAFGNPGGQWSMGYRYDDAGNLVRRKDARGVVTAYGYDGLNRNTTITYMSVGSGAASTPDLTRTYDGATRGKGRLWKSESAQTGLVTIEEYDAAGRPLRQSQKFWTGGVWGAAFNVSYTYDLAGNLKTQAYPSGHSVDYSYDAAGRLSGFAGNLGGGAARTYADSYAYDAAGRVREERFGTETPLYHKRHYNSRGQLFDVRLSTVAWAADQWNWNRGAILNYYGGNYAWEGDPSTPAASDNNGNLRRQQHWVPADDQISSHTFTQQTYEYDALNRLSWVAEAARATNGVVTDSFKQAYDYDRWGNRTINAAGTWLGQPSDPPSHLINEAQFSVDTATNRLGVPVGQTGRMDYDAAGNLVNDSYSPQSYGSPAGQQTRFYDAEGRMTAAADNSGGTTTYAYDADGRRVKRMVGTAAEVWQVYGVGGELLAEYAEDAAHTTPQKEYGYRGGELLVTAEATSAGGGAPPAFTGPDPLERNHQIKLEHLTDLRTAVNQLRQRAGLQPYVFTVDPEPERDVTRVKAEHIRQLRTALEGARTQLGLTIGGYENPTLTENSSLIYAIDFQELRDQIRGAWQGGLGGVDLRWLVTDQLGTPRMVVDKTGSLAGVTRHDYLPFGEELYAGAGGRLTTQGYGSADNVRQKFTGYERDGETTLEYAQARYYSSTIGRFTSPDEPLMDQWTNNPQSWNLYSFVRNNPLRLTDPTGYRAQDPVHPSCQDPSCQPDEDHVPIPDVDNEPPAAVINQYYDNRPLWRTSSCGWDIGCSVWAWGDFLGIREPTFYLMPGSRSATGLILNSTKAGVSSTGVSNTVKQVHHFATNKSSTYTAAMEEIAGRYGLSLDGAWNKELLPHLGRHPNAYHDFVLDGMKRAASEAGGNRNKFIRLFEKYVKEPVRQNPELLRKSGWQP